MNAPLLSITDLSVSYHGRSVLEHISFDVSPGETLGIIGRSGAGKSTIALALTGLLDARVATVAGRIEFEGQDLLQAGEADLCRLRGSSIGMIFQDPVGSLDPAMRVEDQVIEAIQIHERIGRNEARLKARQRLAAAGITAEVLATDPYAHQLSGGMCQRVMVAVALACGPRLLIADEPTSSLDLTLQAQIVHLIKKIQTESGLAIIFISHDLALVSRIADNIAVIHEGELVERGLCDQVLNRPVHEYTNSLVAAWKHETEGSVRIASA